MNDPLATHETSPESAMVAVEVAVEGAEAEAGAAAAVVGTAMGTAAKPVAGSKPRHRALEFETPTSTRACART